MNRKTTTIAFGVFVLTWVALVVLYSIEGVTSSDWGYIIP